jgi:hypothetical protein
MKEEDIERQRVGEERKRDTVDRKRLSELDLLIFARFSAN